MLVKTKSGFEVDVRKETCLKDWEFAVSMYKGVNNGNLVELENALIKLIGENGYKKLKEHIRANDPDGIVSNEGMRRELDDLATSLGDEGKN